MNPIETGPRFQKSRIYFFYYRDKKKRVQLIDKLWSSTSIKLKAFWNFRIKNPIKLFQVSFTFKYKPINSYVFDDFGPFNRFHFTNLNCKKCNSRAKKTIWNAELGDKLGEFIFNFFTDYMHIINICCWTYSHIFILTFV